MSTVTTAPTVPRRFPRFTEYRVADLSTVCLNEDDRSLLTETTNGLTAISYDEGWLIHCGNLAVMTDRIADMRAAGFSDDFIDLICEGNRQGFRYLNFDQDGADDWT